MEGKTQRAHSGETATSTPEGEPMKETTLSLMVRIALPQTDVHRLAEEQLAERTSAGAG